MREDFRDRDVGIFDEALFQEAIFLVEFFQFSLNDFVDGGFRFPEFFRLGQVNRLFPFHLFGRDLLAFHAGRIGCRNLQRDVFDQFLKFFIAGDEVRFTIDFN